MTDFAAGRFTAFPAPDEGRAPPFDLNHLERQAMGDRNLMLEVLVLFGRQLDGLHARLAGASPDERREIAHTLKGAARGVGAFAIGDCAARIEERPGDDAAIEALRPLVDEALGFIAAIGR